MRDVLIPSADHAKSNVFDMTATFAFSMSLGLFTMAFSVNLDYC